MTVQGMDTTEHSKYTAVQSQKEVSAYFTSKQIMPFGFAEQYSMYHVYRTCRVVWYTNLSK